MVRHALSTVGFGIRRTCTHTFQLSIYSIYTITSELAAVMLWSLVTCNSGTSDNRCTAAFRPRFRSVAPTDCGSYGHRATCIRVWFWSRRGPSSTRLASQYPAAISTAKTAPGCRYGPGSYPLACPDSTRSVRLRPCRAYAETPVFLRPPPKWHPLHRNGRFGCAWRCYRNAGL